MAVSESRTVTPGEARTRIKACFATKRPVFLWGPPGIGKSEIIEGITEELGGICYDVRLSQCEPTDLRGLPFLNKEIGKIGRAHV